MKKAIFIAASVLALAACAEGEQDQTSYEVRDSAESAGAVAEMAADDSEAPQLTDGSAAIPASMPKLAYQYGYSYELPSPDISRLMRKHADLCEKQGPTSCQIIGMDLSGNADENDMRGTLQLAVAANHARAVGALLENEAEDSGAEQVSANIAAEEVSKKIIDTEARIRSRTQLRDRLTEVLKTRSGSVEELVAAERQVAQVNEEIDQARSWLKETQGRVSFSKLDVNYSSSDVVAGSFIDPIKNAVGSMGSILGTIVAIFMVLGAIVLPLGGAALGIRAIARKFRPATETT